MKCSIERGVRSAERGRRFSLLKTPSSAFRIPSSALLLIASPVWSCPLCNDAIAKVSGLAKGITWSILLMLAVPILVVTVISFILVRAFQPGKHRPS